MGRKVLADLDITPLGATGRLNDRWPSKDDFGQAATSGRKYRRHSYRQA